MWLRLGDFKVEVVQLLYNFIRYIYVLTEMRSTTKFRLLWIFFSRRLQRLYKMIFWNKCLFWDDIVCFSCFEAFEYLRSVEAFEYFRSSQNVASVCNYEIPDAHEMLTQMEMWANVLCLLVWWGSRKLKIKSFISTKLRKITYFSLHTFWIEMGWWIGYLAQKGQEHP